jgi:hypothetical protein
MSKKLKSLNQVLGKLTLGKKKNTPKQQKNKKIRSARRAHPRNAGILTSEHSNPVYGLMDSVPTTTVVSRGQTAVVPAANEYCLFMGIGDHHKALSSYLEDPATGTIKYLRPIQAIGYRFNASGGSQGWKPAEINNGNVTSSPQYCLNPYNSTGSFKSKVNKATLHMSFMGTQALMSAEFRIFIDYHGDLMETLANTSPITGPSLISTFNTVFNHPRVIKVKVNSGESIDYVLPFPTAQLAEPYITSVGDVLGGTNTGSINMLKANEKALSDSRSSLYGNQNWFYRKESTNATINYDDQGICSTPLVYVACIFQTSAQISCTFTMDCEYHDESLYSVSSPSVCDPLSAGALHTVVMNAHHESTTKPLHSKGLSFKDVVRKAVKAEHVAQSVAASPLGQAVIASAIA